MQVDAEAQLDGHEHVAWVETDDPDGGQTRWKPFEVIAAIRDGERFVVAEPAGGPETVLEPALCPACPLATLTVDPLDRSPPACA